jgi:hypothetical protein
MGYWIIVGLDGNYRAEADTHSQAQETGKLLGGRFFIVPYFEFYGLGG